MGVHEGGAIQKVSRDIVTSLNNTAGYTSHHSYTPHHVQLVHVLLLQLFINLRIKLAGSNRGKTQEMEGGRPFEQELTGCVVFVVTAFRAGYGSQSARVYPPPLSIPCSARRIPTHDHKTRLHHVSN